jgi:hypothetical protein
MNVINNIKTDKKSISELIQESRISINEKVDKSPSLLQIKQGIETFDLFTLGNISTTIGKAKSRKTGFVKLLIRAMLESGLNHIFYNCDNSNRPFVLIDTEQSKYDVWRVAKDICSMAQLSKHPERFYVYRLRPFSPSIRIAMIETILYELNPVFVVIDGVRDLVTDINNPEQATETTGKLMQYSDELNCHIHTIIHMNKGDLSARGHIGTEIINKSETVISATKSKDGSITTIHSEMMRRKDFHDFSFTISNNLPVFCGVPNNKDNDYSPTDETPF